MDLGPWGQNIALALWSAIAGNNRVVIGTPARLGGFASLLRDRIEAGQFRAVIDRRYPLAAIADAYRYVETGQKVGVVVIDVVMWDDFVANSRFPVSTGSSGP
jgi:NADPH:quinone reductase-like Zn-dependent oxidoreductase